VVDFFRRPSSSRQAKPKGLEAGTRRIDDLFSAKAEELSLFSPTSMFCHKENFSAIARPIAGCGRRKRSQKKN
jgi:hypothetical protein